jgi:hypothetical protein
MSFDLILKSTIVGLEIVLAGVLFYKWNQANVRFYSDLPFLFGIAILFVGISGLINLVYTIVPFLSELLIFQIRGVIICFTGATMILAILKIWLFEKPKAVITGGILYSITFLTIIFLSTTPEQIVSLTSPLIGINVILVIVTFGIAYLKKRLPMINPPLLIVGSLIILIGQFSRVIIPGSEFIFFGDILNIVGWIIFTTGFLFKAPYFKTPDIINI